jgi:hypothetical protein
MKPSPPQVKFDPCCPNCGGLHGVPLGHFGECNECECAIDVDADTGKVVATVEAEESQDSANDRYWDRKCDEYFDAQLMP